MAEQQGSGRKYDQKMKPFLVYQYLMRDTDENHFATAEMIAEYLQENFGISAERRSIYRDIQEINKAILAFQEGITLEEAEERILDDEEEKTIKYQSRKGFYVSQRQYTEEDVRLLAECVYAAKFVDEKRAAKLAEVAYSLISDYQADNMRHHVYVTDRVKTLNTTVFYTVNTIKDAIKEARHGAKISFKYLKHTIDNLKVYAERKKGQEYVVSPYALIIDNGNYYLLGIDEKNQARTYRVDRMRGVKIVHGAPIDLEVYNNVDVSEYTQGHFSMFGGEKMRVTMSFSVRLLDTVIERFGQHDVVYQANGKGFFTATATVYVSNQFFGWLCGFGKQAKIVAPASVKKDFSDYLAMLNEWNAK